MELLFTIELPLTHPHTTRTSTMDLDTPKPAAEEAAPGGSGGSSSNMASDSDSDPIIASYPVFTNAAPASTRKLLILQHPNKQGSMRTAFQTLSEVRIKPGSGMIEVDVPLSYHDGSYDRDKGMRWGQSLVRSMNSKSGGSHGLAGGFGVGVPAPRGGGRRREEDREIYDWQEAQRRDQVLRTQTLGGQYAGRNAEGDNECRWMIGVFRDGNLHFTPATSEIQLRPQLHHLDASAEQERLTRPREGLGQAPGFGASGKDGAAPAGQPAAAPKAIHMTIKSNTSGDQPTTETMADRLRHVQTESWQKLKYVGSEEQDAWDLYNTTLLYKPSASAGKQDPKGKGKADRSDEEKKALASGLEKSAVHLQTRWKEEDFLRAVAGKDREGVLEGYGSTVLPGIKPEDVVVEVKKEDVESGGPVKKGPAAGAAKGKGKVAAASATTSTTAKRTLAAKGKGASKASAMEID
ncbi:DNA-directed RNA polymerase III complex subunit Rpc37 [Xylariales sp. AK1849]|nr:DNA-directed RNA polymerase III complex subunit Rpc37 [Xylariales sp. AK1849]